MIPWNITLYISCLRTSFSSKNIKGSYYKNQSRKVLEDFWEVFEGIGKYYIVLFAKGS